MKQKGQVISASRRTDIPAFYSKWFMNRIREGWCGVPNPFNRHQVSRISLKSQDIHVIVFWTRNAHPMLQHLEELDERGYKYYFQYSVLGYPREVDPKSPSLRSSIKTFSELSEKIGPEKVIFRYDPIVFTETMDEQYHLDKFEEISSSLQGKTNRCVISIVDDYKKSRGRVNRLSNMDGFEVHHFNPGKHGVFLSKLATIMLCEVIERLFEA